MKMIVVYSILLVINISLNVYVADVNNTLSTQLLPVWVIVNYLCFKGIAKEIRKKRNKT